METDFSPAEVIAGVKSLKNSSTAGTRDRLSSAVPVVVAPEPSRGLSVWVMGERDKNKVLKRNYKAKNHGKLGRRRFRR
jgi:hypothetical protein